MRPLLKPALRRLWRDPASLQLGIDPAYAVVLDGVDLADAGLLDLLDGTRDLSALRAEAERRGHEPARMHQLLKVLGEAGALDDAPPASAAGDPRRQPDLLSLSLLHREPGAARRVMAARGTATVEVLGAGRIGATIATLLAAAGVGHLALSDNGTVRPADFAPGGVRGPGPRQGSRAEAARALLVGPAAGHSGRAGTARGGPTRASGSRAGSRTGAERAAAAVVLAPVGSVIPPEWLGRVRHRPHLPVTVRETTAVIGPFVLPGRTPCLRCVALTRGDRDPLWPVLAAQLIGAGRAVEACDVALASAAASISALHVLGWLDHGDERPPPSVGGVLELSLTDLRLRRRTVTAHPGCGCGAIDADSSPIYPGS